MDPQPMTFGKGRGALFLRDVGEGGRGRKKTRNDSSTPSNCTNRTIRVAMADSALSIEAERFAFPHWPKERVNQARNKLLSSPLTLMYIPSLLHTSPLPKSFSWLFFFFIIITRLFLFVSFDQSAVITTCGEKGWFGVAN